ncbi:uncharacterized protein LOC144349571 [Saccoglossus kowalevskii]
MCCSCSSLGKRGITRFQVLQTLILSIICVAVVLITSWRIYTEHNYALDDIYFFFSLIPGAVLCLVTLILLLALLIPGRFTSCITGCCRNNNAFYGFFAWCDPLLFMVLQVLSWVPFVSFGRVNVAHSLVDSNVTLVAQEIYDERLQLFDDGEWPWAPAEYNLDLIMVQASLLVIVLVRAFLPRGGVSFENMLKCCALWLSESLDLLAFLDELNTEVLPHPCLPYAVAIAASVSCVQFLAMCTFFYYPSVYSEDEAKAETKGNRFRLGLTIVSAFVDDMPLLVIRVLILKEIYLPLKQISALYFFFIIKSFLFGSMGLALAITEGVKCTSRRMETSKIAPNENNNDDKSRSIVENGSQMDVFDLESELVVTKTEHITDITV